MDLVDAHKAFKPSKPKAAPKGPKGKSAFSKPKGMATKGGQPSPRPKPTGVAGGRGR